MVIFTKYSVDDPVFYWCSTKGEIKESIVKSVCVISQKRVSLRRAFGVMVDLITGQSAKIDDAFVIETELSYKIRGVEKFKDEDQLYDSIDEVKEAYKIVK